jgi:hypothetical protein
MRRPPKACIRVAVALAVVVLAAPATGHGADARDAEFKAAMVYNFARFATWPAARFADPAAPVVLCVDPSEPLAAALLRLEDQPVGGRTLHVRATQVFGPRCHLAFVSASVGPALVTALNHQGVLTIGDTRNFTAAGAIGLITVGRQIRFEINADAARNSGVALSSQLMRLAIAVRH